MKYFLKNKSNFVRKLSVAISRTNWQIIAGKNLCLQFWANPSIILFLPIVFESKLFNLFATFYDVSKNHQVYLTDFRTIHLENLKEPPILLWKLKKKMAKFIKLWKASSKFFKSLSWHHKTILIKFTLNKSFTYGIDV